MKNIEALEKKIAALKADWEEIAFGSEFQGQTKYDVLGKIESEIYLSKQSLEKMKKTISEIK